MPASERRRRRLDDADASAAKEDGLHVLDLPRELLGRVDNFLSHVDFCSFVSVSKQSILNDGQSRHQHFLVHYANIINTDNGWPLSNNGMLSFDANQELIRISGEIKQMILGNGHMMTNSQKAYLLEQLNATSRTVQVVFSFQRLQTHQICFRAIVRCIADPAFAETIKQSIDDHKAELVENQNWSKQIQEVGFPNLLQTLEGIKTMEEMMVPLNEINDDDDDAQEDVEGGENQNQNSDEDP